MLSRRLKTDEYKDICYPIALEYHKQIKDIVLLRLVETGGDL